MALNVVLVQQRQSPKGLALAWSAMEGVTKYLLFVASRKLVAEEIEAAEALGGTDECAVVKLDAAATSVVDDLTPDGEQRFYGVLMYFADGAPRPARFRAVPDGATDSSIKLSAAQGKPAPAARPASSPAAAAAPTTVPAPPRPPTPTGNTGSFKPVAPAQSPTGNTGQMRVGTQAPTGNTGQMRVATQAPTGNTGQMRVGTPAPAAAPPKPAESAPAEDPLEARKRAQQAARDAREAREAAEAPAAEPARAPAREPASPREASPASREPAAPPSQFPLDESFDFRMSGGTQTWDGLRIYWEREPRAAAYEIIVSDHQIFGDELSDALMGKADFTACTAVNAQTLAVIDNITPREARGWYLVLARAKDGKRTSHPFQVGDAATSGKVSAPFVNPNRTGELRGEVEELLGQARENWERWTGEQDGGAKREAKRLVADALLIFPDHPAAKSLLAEMA